MKCLIDYKFDFKRDKINISDLCRTVGISRQAWYNILKSKQEPGVILAINITEYLNEQLEKLGYKPNMYCVDELWIDDTKYLV